MITGSVSSAILGTIRSFTTDYNTFLFFEFMDSLISSGIYSATLILGKKLNYLNPKIYILNRIDMIRSVIHLNSIDEYIYNNI